MSDLPPLSHQTPAEDLWTHQDLLQNTKPRMSREGSGWIQWLGLMCYFTYKWLVYWGYISPNL